MTTISGLCVLVLSFLFFFLFLVGVCTCLDGDDVRWLSRRAASAASTLGRLSYLLQSTALVGRRGSIPSPSSPASAFRLCLHCAAGNPIRLAVSCLPPSSYCVVSGYSRRWRSAGFAGSWPRQFACSSRHAAVIFSDVCPAAMGVDGGRPGCRCSWALASTERRVGQTVDGRQSSAVFVVHHLRRRFLRRRCRFCVAGLALLPSNLMDSNSR